MALTVPQDQRSRAAAAEKAVKEFVKSGTVVGLGTGSTAYWVVQVIGDMVESGALKDMKFVATSEATALEAKKRGLTVVSLDELKEKIAVAIDGADEIWTDPATGKHQLLKGRGAALYREKFIELAAATFVCVADEQKVVSRLGRDYIPIEIVGQWNPRTVLARISEVASRFGSINELKIRHKDDKPLVTDNGNLIADLTYADGVAAPGQLHEALKLLTGVVETGLFIGMDPRVILANNGGHAWLLQGC